MVDWEDVVVVSIKKQTADCSFDKPYANFDALTPGSVFATDGPTKYIAKANQSIIFPRPNEKVGQDVFTVIEEVRYCQAISA
ncbi:MAG: hypothetical protein AAB669_03995 [Patescibacteria group bacterium]|mgnify:CR=1